MRRSECAEVWRPVPGFEALYEVSSYGRVRSLPRKSSKFNRVYGGGVIKPAPRGRYLRVALSAWTVDGKQHFVNVHRLIAQTFLGPIPEGACVRHLNDDPHDNRVCNLAFGTIADNSADAARNGRLRIGERNPQAKLTVIDVIAIRAARGSVSQYKLADQYGVSQGLIGYIQRRKIWKEVA
jgi:hypothetical protein